MTKDTNHMTTINEYDYEPRYTPEAVMTVKGMRPVVRAIAYWPLAHPQGCPLVPECTAIELVTDIGISRWYGCKKAETNSELKMVVTGFPAAFEEMAAWKKVPPPTLKEAKRILAALGLVLKYDRDYEEYSVNFKGGREATRCYTNDLMDAIGTGKMMAAAMKGTK